MAAIPPEFLNMNRSYLSLAEKDVQHQLHPYTDARLHQEVGPLIIERGEGVYVYDNQGKRYLEAMSGLWSVALGFSCLLYTSPSPRD